MSLLFPDARILIFAKAPVAGKVKTRLIPMVGEAGAAIIAEKLIHHTVDTALSEALCPVELWCVPDSAHPLFQDIARQHAIALHSQQGRDLGQRMNHALNYTLNKSDVVILIGTDCPIIETSILQQAFEHLYREQSPVFAPTEDGGYFLIGLSRPLPDLFVDITWGSDQVMVQTRNILKTTRTQWCELPLLWDIDTPQDLQRAQHYFPFLLPDE